MSAASGDAPPVAPTTEDAVVRAASEVLGGPLGRHAAPRRAAPPAAPVLVLAGTGVLGLAALLHSPCRATDWASPGQFTHACYSDVASRVASGTLADSPPGAALATQVLAALAPSARGAFDASVLLAVAALAVAVAALVLLSRHRPWDAAALALSPVLLVAGLVSLELLAVAALALGLLARARARPAAAGALLAAAATVDPLALAVLPATWLAELARPRGQRAGPVVLSAGAAALTLAAVGALWALLGPPLPALSAATGPLDAARALVAAWAPGWAGDPGYGSLWLLPGLPEGASGLPGALVVALAGAGAAATGVLVVVLARRWASGAPGAASGGAPDLAPPLALVALAGAVVTAPAVPVQSSLLLLPLVAACGLRWSEHLPWALVDAAAGTVTWLYIYGQQVPARGAEPWVYALLLVARLAAVAWLALAAVRRHERRGPRGVRSPAAPAGPVDDGPAPATPPVVLTPAR